MQSELTEQWKPIKNYEGIYEISNYGRVKSLKRKNVIKTIIRKQTLDSKGYYRCPLLKINKSKTFLIHHLVWDYFGNRKRNKRIIVVDHIDENKLNNRIDNLQILTHRENTTKSYNNKKHSSKYIGVYYHKSRRKWGASISINGESTFLGRFSSEKEASNAYNKKLIEIKSI